MKKRYAYALAAGLALGNLFGVAAQAQTETGPAAVWKNDPFACIKAPNGVTAYCPNTAGKYLAARSALKDLKWADASNFMEQLTQVDTTTPEIQELALRASVLSGRFSLVQDHIDRLAKADPQNPLAALAKGAMLVKVGNAAEAIEALQAARQDASTDSRLVRSVLRFYEKGQFDSEMGETDAQVFGTAIYDAFNYDLIAIPQELAAQKKFTQAREVAASLPQYRILMLELCLQANPEDTSPLFELYIGAKNRGAYEAALHYLDRYPHGDSSPAIFQAAAGILVMMNEKPAAMQNLKAAAAYFTKKEGDGKALTETDKLLRNLINKDIETLQKQLAPSSPKPAAP